MAYINYEGRGGSIFDPPESDEEDMRDSCDSDGTSSESEMSTCGEPERDGDRLHSLCCNNSAADLERMHQSLERDPAGLNRLQQIASRNEKIMMPPLHDAVASLHENCVRFLLEHGARVFIPGHPSIIETLYTYTDILFEGYAKQMKAVILKILLEYGALENIPINYQPLFDCRFLDYSKQEIELMLQYGAVCEYINPEDNTPFFETPLQRAFFRGKLKIAKLLLMYDTQFIFLPRREAVFFTYMPFGSSKEFFIPIPIQLFRQAYLSVHERGNSMKNATTNFILCMRMFHYFGGNSWERIRFSDNKPGLNILEYLTKLKNSIPEDRFIKKSLPKIKSLICNPMSLRSTCRLSIKRQMGRRYKSNIRNLGLPNAFYPFMKFDDVLTSMKHEP